MCSHMPTQQHHMNIAPMRTCCDASDYLDQLLDTENDLLQ